MSTAPVIAAPNAGTRRLAVEYEPRLVEEAVREALASGTTASGFCRTSGSVEGGRGDSASYVELPPAMLLRLKIAHRRTLDRIYGIAPEAEREAAFRRHFRRMFEQLGLEDLVVAGLDELAGWPWRLEGVLVQAADSPQREGAQLWESRERRGSGAPAYLVVHLTPARFIRSRELIAYLRDELRAATVAASAPRPAAETPSKRRCPLCGFPTIVWASAELLGTAAAAIHADYPDWPRAEGCCEHCADRYRTCA